MNWLGKVFVVLILIMSLVFMGLAMAVYATHKNWKDIIEGPNGLTNKLQEANQRNERLEAQHNRKVEELDAEIQAAEQRVRQLETERVALIARNAEFQAERDQLVQERREATAAVAATQANNEKLAADAATLRQQIRQEQQARDAAFNATLAATEELHQLRNDYEAAVQRQQQLTRDNAGMSHIMRAEGLDPNADPSGVTPTVDGIVSQVRRVAGSQLAEVTIGADDGLKEGDRLQVFRGTRYLGRLEVVETSPDKSVGRVERAYQQGAIQEGDRVATRLN
jgi:phage shock protein A